MKKTRMLFTAAALLAVSVAMPNAWATGDHAHGEGHSHNPCSMHEGHMDGDMHKNMQHDAGMKKGTYLEKADIDGYTVSFHVMKAPEGMAHGGSYHLMIKIEKNGVISALQAVNSKVTHPNDKSESKMMMKMGDWYMAGYDLDHPGQHKIMVLFKTEDGKKHFIGVKYPNNE